jgi:hypothetical protein
VEQGFPRGVFSLLRQGIPHIQYRFQRHVTKWRNHEGELLEPSQRLELIVDPTWQWENDRGAIQRGSMKC